MLKKVGVLGLVLCLIISTISATALAAEVYEKEFSVWDGTVDTTWANDYTKAGMTFEINDAADFAAFRNIVCNGVDSTRYKPFYKCTVNLNCNIDMNNLNWKYGIGSSYLSNYAFFGQFNGNGHIIKNLSINPDMPDAANVALTGDALAANTTAASCFGLFGMVRGDGFDAAGNANASGIRNLHLENVKITIPNKVLSDSNTALNAVYAGALVGCSLNSGNIVGCSVKNVSFYGGYQDYTYNTAATNKMYYYIGGLLGMGDGVDLYACYANGVDFSTMTPAYYASWTYYSGLANVLPNTAAVNLLNLWSANVKYNKGTFNYTAEQNTLGNAAGTAKVTQNFDSLIYPRTGSKTITSPDTANVSLYSDNPERITGASAVDSATVGTFTVSTLTKDSTFATINEGAYEIMYNSLGLEYPICASERVLTGKLTLYANGEEIKTLSAANGEKVTAKLTYICMNPVAVTYNLDIILAGYKNGVLEDVISETKENIGRVYSFGANTYGWVMNVNGAVERETAISLDPTKYDEIKVFCWNSLGNMLPLCASVGIE